MRLFAPIVAVSAAAVVVLAGCSSSSSEHAASSTVPAAMTSQTTPTGADAAVAPAQLDFTAELVDGSEFNGATLAGKDVVFWFWAPWCGECRREAPHVAAVQKATGDRAVFVGVAGRGSIADMQNFVDTYEVGEFAQIADTDGTLWQRFGIVQQPAFAFVSNTGNVEVVRGSMGQTALSARVDALSAS